MNKKILSFFIFFCAFVSLLYSYNNTPVIEICEKQEEMERMLEKYDVTADVSTWTYDQKGKLLKQEHKKIINGKEETKKGNKNKIIEPFKKRYQMYFNYDIKDRGNFWIIKVSLKEKFRKIRAEIGTYVVSKKTHYFVETKTILTRPPYSIFLRSFSMDTKYERIDDELIAPSVLKIVVVSKVIFGIMRKVIIVTKFSYKRKK